MYNEEMKINYINYKKEKVVMSVYFLTSIFNKVSEQENTLQKDICNFTKTEIIDTYKILSMYSYDSIVVLNSALSLYTDWCVQQGITKDNNFNFITSDEISGCVNKRLMQLKIINRKELLTNIEELPNPSDQFLLLALFEGIKGQDFNELFTLKVDDIINEKGVYKLKLLTGKVIVLSKKLITIAQESTEEYMYYPITGNQTPRNYQMTGDKIIKDMYNASSEVSDFQRGRRIYTKVKRALDYIGLDIMSPNDLYISGQIDMINTLMKENNIQEMEDFINLGLSKKVEMQYNCTIDKVYIRKYKDFIL